MLFEGDPPHLSVADPSRSEARLEPWLRLVVALDPGDVALRRGVVPVARDPRADAAPECVVLAVGGDDLGHGLPVVEPGGALGVEGAVVTGPQARAPVVGVERGVVLRVGV